MSLKERVMKRGLVLSSELLLTFRDEVREG